MWSISGMKLYRCKSMTAARSGRILAVQSTGVTVKRLTRPNANGQISTITKNILSEIRTPDVLQHGQAIQWVEQLL